MCVCICVYVCACMYVCVYVCMYEFVCVCMCVLVYVAMCVCVIVYQVRDGQLTSFSPLTMVFSLMIINIVFFHYIYTV